ncbi:pyridoxine 5'-phosphate synthase [Blattabacterium cuenoti]|nr:pyridoxine 5'-phosphate synthase [Blattabacterium cuenoti]
MKYNLPINSGHDINLYNINFLIKKVPGIVELYIGHALISDSLYLGL